MTEAAPTTRGTGKRRWGAVAWLGLIVGLVSAVLLVSVLVWWGPLREWAMDPGVPFETYDPPPPPDYLQSSGWLPVEWPELTGEAAIFFIHPTTYEGRNWNAPADLPRAERLLDDVFLPNYAGPFQRVGRIYAPRYRQASLYTTLTLREDAREARAFAYDDIRRAFQVFVSRSEQRPILIVGVEQGAVLAERLAREFAADPAVKPRLAAVYLIEAAFPAEDFGPDAPLPACRSREQTGCVAAYLAEAHNDAVRTRDRLRHAPVWENGQLAGLAGRKPLCFNPLKGAVTDEQAGPQENTGAANATGFEWGVRPGYLQHQVAARCEDGVLKLTRPRSPALRPGLSWTERQRVRPYNVFYADLEADALARVAAMSKAP